MLKVPGTDNHQDRKEGGRSDADYRWVTVINGTESIYVFDRCLIHLVPMSTGMQSECLDSKVFQSSEYSKRLDETVCHPISFYTRACVSNCITGV